MNSDAHEAAKVDRLALGVRILRINIHFHLTFNYFCFASSTDTSFAGKRQVESVLISHIQDRFIRIISDLMTVPSKNNRKFTFLRSIIQTMSLADIVEVMSFA